MKRPDKLGFQLIWEFHATNENFKRMKKYIIQFTIVFSILLLQGCKDAWDDYSELSDSTASATFLEELEKLPEYSNFLAALKSTGLSDTLLQAKMFTVWVPSNTSLTALPEDATELYQFVANHINKGGIQLYGLEDEARIKMLSGKALKVDKNSIDEVTVESKDIAIKNGFMQLIQEQLTPKNNIWDYIESYETANKHIDYLNSLSGEVFDEEVATITGYTDDGLPIYDIESGMVWKNSFLDDVADLRVEDSTYTVLIIDDEAFSLEFETYTPYYKVTSATTDEAILINKEMCEYKITKDYVFTQDYSADEIPAELLSVDSVMVPINKSLITSSVKCSNGWVHHISSCAVPLANKIQPIIIEAETLERFYDNYTVAGDDIIGSPAGYKRVREAASGGYDYVLDNSSSSTVGTGYIMHAGEVSSTTYKFYWKAVNDFNGSYRVSKGDDYILKQKLGYTTLISENNFTYDFNPMIGVSDYIEVTDLSYEEAQEVEVGFYKFTSMRDIYLWLQNEDSGAAVVADYIKLVPHFE